MAIGQRIKPRKRVTPARTMAFYGQPKIHTQTECVTQSVIRFAPHRAWMICWSDRTILYFFLYLFYTESVTAIWPLVFSTCLFVRPSTQSKSNQEMKTTSSTPTVTIKTTLLKKETNRKWISILFLKERMADVRSFTPLFCLNTFVSCRTSKRGAIYSWLCRQSRISVEVNRPTLYRHVKEAMQFINKPEHRKCRLNVYRNHRILPSWPSRHPYISTRAPHPTLS